MAAWTKADVKMVAPEFETLSDAVIDYAIGIADRQISASAFGDRVVEAGSYLTAHLLFIRKNTGATGPVTGVTVGQVSMTYGMIKAAMHADSLASNRYGQEYERLCDLGAFGIMVI